MRKTILSIIMALAVMICFMPASFAGTSQGTADPVLLAKAVSSGSSSFKVSWNETKGATRYVVYGAKCSQKISAAKGKTVKGTSLKVSKLNGKKIKAHKSYKFKVKAYKGKTLLATSRTIHVIAGGTQGKYGNVTKVTAKKKSVTLKVGKTAKVGVTKKIYKGKKHVPDSHGAATRYISGSPKVATVSSKGVVTAKKAGKAKIYIQDIGGRYAVTTVTVVSPVKEYTVRFDANGGTGTMEAETFKAGVEKELAKNAFTKSGYTFEGWNTSKDGSGTSYTDGQKVSVKSGLTLYAQWKEVKQEAKTYTVSFEMNEHGTAISPVTVKEGETASKPAEPSEEGYTFGGWYTDSICSKAFDFSTAITEDITVYAKWTKNMYTVTFDLNGYGATTIEPQTVAYGEKAVEPENPAGTNGYNFTYWHADSSCSIFFDFDTPITQDTTIYAGWRPPAIPVY